MIFCGGFESVLLRFRGSNFFWLLGGGGGCEVHLNNGSSETAVGWILMDGKWKKKRLERACSWSFSGLIHCGSFRVFH